jgi:hypothetical protein
MTATIWLILNLGTAMMHARTFDSMDACQKAAHDVWVLLATLRACTTRSRAALLAPCRDCAARKCAFCARR